MLSGNMSGDPGQNVREEAAFLNTAQVTLLPVQDSCEKKNLTAMPKLHSGRAPVNIPSTGQTVRLVD